MTITRVVATVLVHSAGPGFGAVLAGLACQDAAISAVLILDNASREPLDARNCSKLLEPLGCPVEVHRTETNLGVGGGHNFLLARARQLSPDYFWILEHDTITDPDCLSDLLSARSAWPSDRIGALVPNLARSDDERHLYWPAEGEPRPAPTHEAQRFTFNALLIDRRAYDDVGALRDDLFVGGEDWDYSRRFVERGWTILQQVRPTGTHATRGAHRHGELPSPLRQYYSVRSQVLLARGFIPRAKAVGIGLAGSARDLRRPLRAQRLAARVTGVVDGLVDRTGQRTYWFMSAKARRDR